MPDLHPYSHSCLRKLHGYAVRFAWAIHLFYTDDLHESPISLQSMELAIELCYALLQHIEHAYNPAGLAAVSNAEKVLEFFQGINLKIDTLAYGYTDSRTIQQRIHKPAKDVMYALETLNRLNYIDIIDAGTVKNIVVPHPHLLNQAYQPMYHHVDNSQFIHLN